MAVHTISLCSLLDSFKFLLNIPPPLRQFEVESCATLHNHVLKRHLNKLLGLFSRMVRIYWQIAWTLVLGCSCRPGSFWVKIWNRRSCPLLSLTGTSSAWFLAFQHFPPFPSLNNSEGLSSPLHLHVKTFHGSLPRSSPNQGEVCKEINLQWYNFRCSGSKRGQLFWAVGLSPWPEVTQFCLLLE